VRSVLHLPNEIKQHLPTGDVFDAVMQLTGKAFRDVSGRKTIQVQLGAQSYFVKQHLGIGWGEITKNLFSLKKPVLGAMTEVQAIQTLKGLGIPTTPLVAYGQRGSNPATLQSFVMTEDLGNIVSLEDLCGAWQTTLPTKEFKQSLIIAVAQLAAKFHGAGLCHRDFYLCHFVLKQSDLDQGKVELYLIDLHRVLHHQSSNGKTVMKDIAGLYFSAMDYEFDAEDGELFKQHYLTQSEDFWMSVKARAKALYAKFNSKKFQDKLAAERAKLD